MTKSSDHLHLPSASLGYLEPGIQRSEKRARLNHLGMCVYHVQRHARRSILECVYHVRKTRTQVDLTKLPHQFRLRITYFRYGLGLVESCARHGMVVLDDQVKKASPSFKILLYTQYSIDSSQLEMHRQVC